MRLTIQQSRGILGVSSDASPEHVRQAYRKLALQCHPDKNPDDPSATDKFQQLSAAYKRICDHHNRRAGTGDNNRARRSFHSAESDEFSCDDDDDSDAELNDMDISFEEMLKMFELMFGGGGLGRATSTTAKAKLKKPQKKRPSAKTATSSTRAKAPPQVRVPLRSGRGVGNSSRRAPVRGGFTSASLFGSAEEVLFQSFATMEMAREMGGLDKDFAAMRSFFGNSFGDSDFSFCSDLDSSEYEEDTEPFTARRPVQKQPGNHTSATVASSCEPKPTPSPPSPTNQDQYDASNEDECKPRDVSGTESESKGRVRTVEVEDRVRVFGKLVGVVKFNGPVHYTKGDFVGVQLSEPLGKNDGTVKGVSYFACPPQCGLMVRPEDVALVDE